MKLLTEYFGLDVDEGIQMALVNYGRVCEDASDKLIDRQPISEAEIKEKLFAAFMEYHLQRAAQAFCDDVEDGKANL